MDVHGTKLARTHAKYHALGEPLKRDVGHLSVESETEMKFQVICLALLVVAGSVCVSAQTTDEVAVVAAVAPVYPAIAAAAHAIGDVAIEVKIDASGKVTSAHAVNGHALLQAASVAAARRWKFAPAKESNGERTVLLTFTFLETKADVPDYERTAVFLPPYKVEVGGPKLVIQASH